MRGDRKIAAAATARHKTASVIAARPMMRAALPSRCVSACSKNRATKIPQATVTVKI